MITMHYSKKELLGICDKMTAASNDFYVAATRTGNHAFIEFTGLMNEYIKICREAAHTGVDFTQASTHTRMAIPIQSHQAFYLAEKLNCILGPALGQMKPALRKEFCDRLLES